MLVIFSVCLVVVLHLVSSQNSTCPYQKFVGAGETHTACLPPNTSCTIVNQGVSNDEKTLILMLHNSIRNNVANGQGTGLNGVKLPQAQNMRQLEWNEELAKIAQAHTNQCSLSPDCYRCRGTEEYATGENLFYQFQDVVPQRNDWTSAVAYWNKTSTQLSSIKARNYQYSAFTQLVWAQSKDIGCGMTRFRGQKYRYTDYFVCLYGPAGNYMDKDVYESGAPCSDCTYDSTCCGSSCKAGLTNYTGLCKMTGK